MNIPALELKAFLEEYSSIVFPGHRVVRADFFRHRETLQWRPVFVLTNEGKQCLAIGETILCQYDRITSLYAPPEKTKIAWTVDDLLEQLSGLRSKVYHKDYEKARNALAALAQPLQPFCPAFLVEQDGLLGVADPMGQLIVPVEYAHIETFAFTDPGEANLFLCHQGGHELNAMDVYDQQGNCIFHKIGGLHPREETLLTPAGSDATSKKTKSLWVIRQSIDRPFPENPDFQLLREEPRRFTMKELRSTGDVPMEERSVWRYCPEETPSREVLLPLANVIGKALGFSAEEILDQLPDYRRFRRDQTPLALRLAKVTADTPLDKLELSIRAHHCLVRSGLRTASDVAALSEDALHRLRRCTPEILEEITELRAYLKKLGL